MKITHDYAILAPIPIMHLQSGIEVCDREGEVAFASAKWEFFYELNKDLNGDLVEVFIYPSWTGNKQSDVSWHGVYVRCVQALRNGKHPQGNRFRPASTHDESNDGNVIYWHIRRLCQLPNPIPISSLCGKNSNKCYTSSSLPPRSPVLIKYPPGGPLLVEES